MTNLSLAWTGDYNGLKSLVNDDLKLNGIWKQPGGHKKVFTSTELTSISWSKDKKVLTIVGKDSEQLKQTLCSMLIGENIVLNSKEVSVSTKEPNRDSQKSHVSRCPDYNLDIESLQSGKIIHGQAIQTLGESISKVNEVLSELKDLVHQHLTSKIEQSNIESLCVTSDECISEANMHVSRSNSSANLNNNTIVINDERLSEVEQPTFVNYRKGEKICDANRLIEDNRNNGPTANDSFGSKSTQLISKINTGVVVSTKDNWDKQIDDYRNKQHDACSRLNCQSGQNTGMSIHSVIPSRQRVETTKQINPRVREQNTQTKRFLFRNTKGNHRLKNLFKII